MWSILNLLYSPWTIGLAVFSFYILKRILQPNDFFEKKGFAYKKPWPMVGSMGGVVFWQESMFDMIINAYSEFRGHKYFGFFDFNRPVLYVRDPEFIKQITVKDFDNFLDHRSFLINLENAPLFAKSLFMLKGQRWRDMRATLSPAFTGSRMRQMFQLIVEVSEQATVMLAKEANESPEPIVRDMKEVFSRYSTDIVASTAFGLKVDSFKDRDNEFYQIGKSSFTGIKIMLKVAVMALVPRIAGFFKIALFPKKETKFFHEVVHGAIAQRKQNGIIRPDMIQLLMEAQKGTLKQEISVPDSIEGFATVEEVSAEKLQGSQKQVWDDDDVTSQCFLFFLAGFDTISSLLSFAAIELMANPDVQQKLYEECVNVREELNDTTLSYDVLQKMKYLDKVVSETLRKWPVQLMIDRQCVKQYEWTDESGRKLKLNKGDEILIPVVAIHRDPEYYPEPDRFDPERFNEDRKSSIRPFTYLPFGAGPRNCIGSRFALIECKALLYYLLLNFTFEPAPNSIIPVQIAKSGFSLVPENGFKLIVKTRN